MKQYNSPSNKQRSAVLSAYGVTERLCRESERKRITTLSRSRTWELENLGQFPKRRKLGNANAWLLSDLLLWAQLLNEGGADE